MTKIFLPPLDSRWRLLGDHATDAAFRSGDNCETLTGDSWTTMWRAAVKVVGNPAPYGTVRYDEWNKRFEAFKAERLASYGFDGVIPTGTIIQIERYHVSRSGENIITTKVLLSPTPYLTPKKRGGKMRGKGLLYFSLAGFNQLPEIEEVTDALD